MEINTSKKKKLKKLLESLATTDEKSELKRLDEDRVSNIIQSFKEEEIESESNYNRLLEAFSRYASASSKHNQIMMQSLSDLTEGLSKNLEKLGGTISTSYEKNKPFNAAGVYKDMINQLSAINESVQKKPVPVWNWPQYASVGVRDKSFANIDPSQSFQDTSTTPTKPYIELLGFDNAGTVARVTNNTGLPVNLVSGSVSITSPGISGLKVDLSKFSLGTAALAGLRVFQENSPAVTVASSPLSGLVVNLQKANTAVLAGLKVFVENQASGSNAAASATGAAVPASAGYTGVNVGGNLVGVTGTGTAMDVNLASAVTSSLAGIKIDIERSISLSITSPSLAGVKINKTQINGVAVAVAAAGIQKVGVADGTGTAITSTGAALDVNLKTSSITQNVSIAGATTSVLAGVKVDVERWTALTSSLAGIRVFQENTPSGTQNVSIVSATTSALAGTKIDVERWTAGTSPLSGIQVVFNGAKSNVPINLAAATTSVLAGARVFVNNPTTSPIPINNAQIAGSTIATAATGIQKVGVTDGSGTAITSTGSALDVNLKTSSITQNVAIAAATTSVLAGTKFEVERWSAATSSLAGLKINYTQINGVTIDTNTGNASAGSQRVVIASNNPNVPTNIAAATTSVLAGTKVEIERWSAGTSILSGLQVVFNGAKSNVPINIAAATTSVLAGAKVFVNNPTTSPVPVNNSQVAGSTIATAATGIAKVGLTDGSGTAITSTGAALDVNVKSSITQNVSIAGATTSVLAGVKVEVERWSAGTANLAGLRVVQETASVGVVTTAIVGIAASGNGDNQILPAPGAGKQIFVYAWNLSFSGTCNAKFTDGLTSKLLCGLIYGIANAGGANSVSPNFLQSKPQPDLFHTAANSRLLLNLSAGQAVGGSVSYWIQ